MVDLTPLRRPDDAAARRVGDRLATTLADHGFLRVVGHGADPALLMELQRLAEQFFSLPVEVRASVAMDRFGAAWRGWFPVGGELTAGTPDAKEGLYLGLDLPATDPRVAAGRPLHGPNPELPVPGLRTAVDRWMAAATEVGRTVLRGLAIGLGLPADHFDTGWCADPVVLFRIFRYPAGDTEEDGVGPHTDYGLLTVLAQDGVDGLEVEHDGRWVAVPADPEVLVVNGGDMLQLASGGRFRPTRHRVRPPARDRLSFPLFLDPGWDVEVHADGHRTYGDYLSDRVSRVFPDLFARAVTGNDATSGDDGIS